MTNWESNYKWYHCRLCFVCSLYFYILMFVNSLGCLIVVLGQHVLRPETTHSLLLINICLPTKPKMQVFCSIRTTNSPVCLRFSTFYPLIAKANKKEKLSNCLPANDITNGSTGRKNAMQTKIDYWLLLFCTHFKWPLN